MASELSRFIDEELLKDGKDGELAKLLARQNSQRAKARRPAFLGFCNLRSICCLIIFAIVAAAVIATAQKSEAPKKVISWARSKGKAPSGGPSPQEPKPFPGKQVGQTNVAVSREETGPDATTHIGRGGAAQTTADAGNMHADTGQQPEAGKQPVAAVAPVPAPEPDATAPAPAPEPAASPSPDSAPSLAATQHPFADASQPAAVPEAAVKPSAAAPVPAPEASVKTAAGKGSAAVPAPAQEVSPLDPAHKARRRSGAGRKLLAC